MIKKQWEIISVLLAASTAILAIDKLIEKPADNLPVSEVVLDSIMTRNSVRKYTDERVSDEDVEKILKAGMAAPTAANRQPWRFYVVRDKELIKRTTKVTNLPHNERRGGLDDCCLCVPFNHFRSRVNRFKSLPPKFAGILACAVCGVYPPRTSSMSERSKSSEGIFVGFFNIQGETPVKDKWSGELNTEANSWLNQYVLRHQICSKCANKVKFRL